MTTDPSTSAQGMQSVADMIEELTSTPTSTPADLHEEPAAPEQENVNANTARPKTRT